MAEFNGEPIGSLLPLDERAMKHVCQRISALPTLGDGLFVQEVRQIESTYPYVRHWPIWTGAVRQELDMRLLLKRAEAA